MRAISTPLLKEIYLLKQDSLLAGRVHFLKQLVEELRPLLGSQLALQLFQCQRDDVIVVGSRKLGIGRNVEPELVHELDILSPHARRVWAESVFTQSSIGRADFQHQTRTRLRQSLPGIAGELCLFVGSQLIGKTANDPRG